MTGHSTRTVPPSMLYFRCRRGDTIAMLPVAVTGGMVRVDVSKR